MESKPVSCKSVAEYYQVEGKLFEQQYKESLSGFRQWEQLTHANDYVLFKENMGEYLSIDEVAVYQGELYTVLTNKSKKGKSGALVAMIKGTQAETIITVFKKISTVKRLAVKEITADLSASMHLMAKRSFPNAILVADRFHVQQLIGEALSDLRIEHRWETLENENQAMKIAKENGKIYKPMLLENGDTPKQLLARSRYLLFKHHTKWTPSQIIRAKILFKQYPDIEKAYKVAMQLTSIYNRKVDRGVALAQLALWYNQIEELNNKHFNTLLRTFQNNYAIITNYFLNRSTNASAESFNAKIKEFRRQFRGVRDVPFFLFRLTKIYA